MKTSALPPNVRKAKKRHTASFIAALCVYAPLLGFVFFSAPTLTFKAAGNVASVSLSFAQIAGGISSAQAAPVETQPEPEPEPVEEKAPEPEIKPEPEPQPEPVVEKKAVEPKPVVEKKAVEPKPVVKKEVVKPKPRKEKPKEKKPVKRPPKKEAVKPVPQPKPSPEQTQPAETKPTVSDTPTTASHAGGQTASSQQGISTLVYGEANDPFLARVKREVESHLGYPRRARVMRLEGVTVVQFVIDTDGSRSKLEIYRGSGHKILDKAAMQAVDRAKANWGKPTKTVRLRFPIKFELKQ